MHFSPLAEIVILFLLSILVNLAASKIRLPATVGFLLTGVLCGPSVLGLVSDKSTIDHVADLGVAMLMFTIGMELSGDALNRLKKPVFVGGSLQIGLIIAACWGLGLYLGNPKSGVLWGCLFALSSSAIVLQIFQQKGIAGTPVGRLDLAILVFQDMMVAPMMLLIPMLSGQLELTANVLIGAAVKILGLAAGMFIFSKFLLDRLMNAVVGTRAREILLLTTLVLCLGFASITSFLGMSMSLGAFLAGLMLARSQYSMSVIADILPYKDVFMSLFFISVGMMLNINFVISHAGLIAGLVAAFIVLKTLFCMPSIMVQGYPLKTAIMGSLCLAQVGEFSFVLAASGVSAGLLNENTYQMFLALSVISMMLTPGLISASKPFAAGVCRVLRKIGLNVHDGDTEAAEETASDLTDHIIIIGFGFSGKTLANAAKECRLPFNILEMNPETVNRYRGRLPISYGDASQPSILESLGIERARAIAIVISDPAAVRAIVVKARAANPQITIIARTSFVTEVGPLHALGANYVVAEEFESALEVFSQVLSTYLVPRQDIERLCDHARHKSYRMVRRMTHSAEDLGSLVDRLPEMGVQALRLDANAPLCEKTLSDTAIRNRFSVTLVAVYRDPHMYPSPDGNFVLKGNDVLYVFGTMDRLYAFKTYLSGKKTDDSGRDDAPLLV